MMTAFFCKWRRKLAGFAVFMVAYFLIQAAERSYTVTDNISIDIGGGIRESIISSYGDIAWARVREPANAPKLKSFTWRINDPDDSLRAKGGKTSWSDDPQIQWRWRWCGMGVGSTERTTFWILGYQVAVIPFAVVSSYLFLVRSPIKARVTPCTGVPETESV
jgi:hypothetical protein